MNQLDMAARFRALHEAEGAFVIPNPWDAGGAKIMEGCGFKALATTSAGVAYGLGRVDGRAMVSRAEALANARQIIEATTLPVSADLENGFADDPEGVAETMVMARDIGLAGASVEDATPDPSEPIYGFNIAVARVAAAAETLAKTSGDFLLTARAENFLHGRPDLDDTIRRLQAYEAAGADVLYAPGLPSLAAVERVCASVSKPVNVILAGPLRHHSVAELAAAGAKRISIGSGLARATLGLALRASREMADGGTFSWLEGTPGFDELNAFMDQPED